MITTYHWLSPVVKPLPLKRALKIVGVGGLLGAIT
jgi:hypothetical protein